MRATLSYFSHPIRDLMQETTRNALDAFNSQANRSSGNTNPHDFRRWVQFVTTALENGDYLDEHEVQKMLIEAGWGEQIAGRLATEFRINLRFLDEYRSQRAGQS